MFCGDIDPVILSGYEKKRAIIIKDIESEAVGGLSWNTGPETSICMKASQPWLYQDKLNQHSQRSTHRATARSLTQLTSGCYTQST
jgi:hypothetical protein